MHPAVITSKAAKDDLLHIRSVYDELVQGIAGQSAKIQNANMQRQSALQAQNTMKMEMEKEKNAASSAARRDYLDFAQKQAETDIKRAALSTNL